MKVKKVFKVPVENDNILNKSDTKMKIGTFICSSLPWSLWISITEERGLLGKKNKMLNLFVKCDYEEKEFSTKCHIKLTLFNKSSFSDLVFPINYNKLRNSDALVGKYGIIKVNQLRSKGFILNDELSIGISLEAKRFVKTRTQF